MTDPTNQNFVRAPSQGRSRASFERVLETATELLATRGYEGFTLQDVSVLSKASIGSIYGRVKGKDDLVRAVQIRVLQKADDEQIEMFNSLRSQHASLASLIPATIFATAEYLKSHGALFSAFMTRAPFDPVIASTGKMSFHKFLQGFKSLLLAHRDEIAAPDPHRSVETCFVVVYAALSRYLGLGMPSEMSGAGGWEDFKSDLSRMCLLYMTTELETSNGEGAKKSDAVRQTAKRRQRKAENRPRAGSLPTPPDHN
ncbi:TetR/AcrR family transcriptional regulator [Paraburkholderia metrosideri]|nr:TetR/AcrR family transcriptional regulator [Paraburkholderia metrosideri]